MHRLLKNLIFSDYYVLFSQDLMTYIEMPVNYKSMLLCFRESLNTYYNISIQYTFFEVQKTKLNLKAFPQGIKVKTCNGSQMEITKSFSVKLNHRLESITKYKHRHTDLTCKKDNLGRT